MCEGVEVLQSSLLEGDLGSRRAGEGGVASLARGAWGAKRLDRRADVTGGGGRMIHRLESGRGREGVASM